MQNLMRIFWVPFVLGFIFFSTPAAADEIIVFAAASLTNALNDAGKAF
jgi:ABC-type molybdate transport system substrate-binding protein